ncbi:hypothetical protein COCON_G00236230, partial [Conger conger]
LKSKLKLQIKTFTLNGSILGFDFILLIAREASAFQRSERLLSQTLYTNSES